jgi:transcriptional regulator with XRE-family HTH domain
MSTPDEFARAVGCRIRAFRKERGMTQEQLADKVGASRSLISCYENGKFSPNGFSLVRLADALGVRTDQLLGAKVGDTLKQLDDWLLRIPSELRGGLRHLIHSYLKDHEIGKPAPGRTRPASPEDRSLRGIPPRSSTKKEDAE